MSFFRQARLSFWRKLATIFLLCICLAGTAAAQTVAPDYDDWNSMVQRVEGVLEQGRASDATMERLRQELSKWRDKFVAAEQQNDLRVDRLNRQIAALGAPPAEGEVESEEVATRRTQLTTQLDGLKLPSLRATEAYIEADGLITEVDVELRERQAQAALSDEPSPINPLNWVSVVREVEGFLVEVGAEIKDAFKDPQTNRDLGLVPSLFAAVFFFGLGVVMLRRSRQWNDALDNRIDDVQPRPLRRALRLIVVLLQLAVPYAGLVSMLVGTEISGVLGSQGSAILFSLSIFGFLAVIGLWLVRQLFPLNRRLSPLRIDESRLARSRWAARLLILIGAAKQGLTILSEQVGFSEQTSSYLVVPFTVAMAGLMINMAHQFRASTGETIDIEDERGFIDSVIRILCFAAMAICVISLIAIVLGYLNLSEKLVYPAVTSFFWFGFLALAHNALSDFYALFSSKANPREESLVPVLIGIVLILLSLPILALVWGARVTDLTEFFVLMREGFSIGEFKISPSEVLAFLIVFALGYGFTRLIQAALNTTILPKTGIDLGGRTAIVSGVGYVGITVAGLIAVTTAGIDLSNLAIFASALAVGVGFGLQTIVSNFVSGIILLVERPVSEGDWIEVGGQMGYVRRISVRATRIETFDRTDVIVPNSDLVSGTVTNWTRGNLIGRIIVPVGVAYGSDTHKVAKILDEIANSHPLVVLSPPPSVLFIGFGADSLDFEIRAILRDVNFSLGVKSDMNHEIAARFKKEGIEIPFAQRDIWLRNPEVLPGAHSFGRSSRHNLQDEDTTSIAENTPAYGTATPRVPPMPEDIDGSDGGESDR